MVRACSKAALRVKSVRKHLRGVRIFLRRDDDRLHLHLLRKRLRLSGELLFFFVRKKIRDYLDDIRANLPGELRQAQQIVNDRAQIVDTANAQAQAIVKKAEERARILVSDAEIVKAAQQRAAEITAAAQSESRTLRQTVTDYCDNMLKTTEEAMVENAAQVKNVRANLRQNAKKNG